MGKSRDTGNLVSTLNVFSNITNDTVGIGRSNSVEKLESNGAVAVNGQTTANRTSSGTFDYFSTGIRLLSWGAAATTGTISFWSGAGGSGTLERARFDTSGNLLINTTTPTGTSSQPFQVSGGAYVSGAVGLGTTNPVSELHVNGEITLGSSPFIRNIPTISSNYTVTSTYNEMSVGPITINSGVTVTVNSGATWTIV